MFASEPPEKNRLVCLFTVMSEFERMLSVAYLHNGPQI